MERDDWLLTMAWTAAALLLSGPVLASGRASGPQEEDAVVSARPLDGTEWRLVEIQSMDDSIGTVRPEDSSLYTMRLNSDGTVNMRLNCNRAHGTWSTEPSQSISNGRFEFGPLAITRAFCPTPAWTSRLRLKPSTYVPIC